MLKITSFEQFNELQQGNTVFVFSANWCPDCRFIEPFMPDVEAQFPEFTFAEVDRDQFIDLYIEHNIYGIPSFLVYRNGKLVGSFVSKLRKTKQEIVQFLESVK